jgi:hypothetical protein
VPTQTHYVPFEQWATARPPFRAKRDVRGLSGLRQGVRIRLEQDVHPATGETRMKNVRSAISQGTGRTYKADLYHRRRKGGLCVTCGNPVAILEEHVASIILRGSRFVVERGRPARRCSGCLERERIGASRRQTRKLPQIAKIDDTREACP